MSHMNTHIPFKKIIALIDDWILDSLSLENE